MLDWAVRFIIEDEDEDGLNDKDDYMDCAYPTYRNFFKRRSGYQSDGAMRKTCVVTGGGQEGFCLI